MDDLICFSTSDIYALYKKYELLDKEKRNGDLYQSNPKELRPALGFKMIYRYEDEQALRATLRKAGLVNFAELLRFDFFKERAEKRTLVYAPIVSHVIKMQVGVMREVVAGEHDNSVKKELEFILKHISAEAPDSDFYHLPRIKLTDLPEDIFEAKIKLCSSDLIPSNLRTRITNDAWEKLLNEILDERYRDSIRKVLEDLIQDSLNNPRDETFEDGQAYVIHGGKHEASHLIAGHFSPEDENALFKIFLTTQTVLYFKNMLKAMSGAQSYRQRLGEEPSKQTLMNLFSIFVNEMLADYLAIYMSERAGETHYYSTKHGIEIPSDLRGIFDNRWMVLQELDKKRMISVFSEDVEKNSKMIAAQKIGN